MVLEYFGVTFITLVLEQIKVRLVRKSSFMGYRSITIFSLHKKLESENI